MNFYFRPVFRTAATSPTFRSEPSAMAQLNDREDHVEESAKPEAIQFDLFSDFFFSTGRGESLSETSIAS